MSAAAHLALLVFIGTHLTQAYVLPEQALHDIPPVEAILVPEPPPSVALPEPELRRLEPTLAPQGQLVTQPAPAPTPPIPAQAAPQKKKKDEDKALAAQPRLAAPNPTPLTVAPLNMAPVLRPPALPPTGVAARPAPGGANDDFTVKPSGQVEGGLRGALRASTVGCENRNTVALNGTEREKCDERVGARGTNAPVIAVGTELNRDKRGGLQSQADLVEAMRKYKQAAPPAGNASTTGQIGELLGAPKPRLGDRP